MFAPLRGSSCALQSACRNVTGRSLCRITQLGCQHYVHKYKSTSAVSVGKTRQGKPKTKQDKTKTRPDETKAREYKATARQDKEQTREDETKTKTKAREDKTKTRQEARALVEEWLRLAKRLRASSEERITAKHTIDRLMQVLEPQLPSLPPKYLSRIWLGAKDLKVQSQSFLKALAAASASQAAVSHPSSIAGTLNAMAALNYKCGDLLAKLCASTLHQADLFESNDIALSLNAFSKISFKPDAKVLLVLCKAAVEKASSFQPKQLAVTLNALSKLDWQPGQDVLKTLSQQASNKVEQFNARNISHVLSAFASIGYDPGHTVWTRFCEAAVLKRQMLDAQGLATTLNAVARMPHEAGETQLRFLAEEAVRRARTLSWNAHSLPIAMNALAKLAWDPGEAAMNALCAQVEVLADSLTPQSLSVIVNALGRLAHQPRSLSVIVNALGRLAHQPRDAVLTTLCVQMMKKADLFEAQSISLALNALAKFHIPPDHELLRALCTRGEEIADSFEAQELANTLNALVKLNYPPGNGFLDRFVQVALRYSESFGEQDIASTLHALTVFNRHDPDLLSRLLEGLAQLPQPLHASHLMQLHYVQLSLEFEQPPGRAVFFPQEIAQACRARLEQAHQQVLRSRFHTEVSDVLRQQLHLEHVNEDSSLPLPVDIRLTNFKVLIEVDGPSHFVPGSVESKCAMHTLTVSCKTRLLRAMGWQVVCIPFYEWRTLSLSEQGTYIADKLRQADVDCTATPYQRTSLFPTQCVICVASWGSNS
eukprot:g23988.t1